MPGAAAPGPVEGSGSRVATGRAARPRDAATACRALAAPDGSRRSSEGLHPEGRVALDARPGRARAHEGAADG
jgi:hypothetical protein